MAFVHCHDCSWSQDDFWSMSYNPLKHLLSWETLLLDFERLDRPFTDDSEFIKENGNMTAREVIARECERAAASIREMAFLTEQNWKGRRCPACGSTRLDVD